MGINEWRKKPTEEQSFRIPFFATVACLILLTGVAIWDETFHRRPWKDFQQAFFKLELEKASEEFNVEKEKFESESVQKIYHSLQEKLKTLRNGPQDPQVNKSYVEAKSQLTGLQYKLEDLSKESQFTKSRFDAAYYLFEKAKIENSSNLQEKKQKVEELQKELDKISLKIKEVENQNAPLWKIVQAHDEEVSNTEKELVQMTTKLQLLEKKVSDVKGKSPKIEQIVIKNLNRVDRCQTCHLGIDRPGFEDPKKYPQPFRTHPNLDVLLKKHPPEKFGCTSCHGGQGAALTVNDAHGEVHHWESPLLRGKKVESSCRKCHATVQVPEASKLTQGKVLFGQLGCSGCHLALGYDDAKKVGPELDRIHEKTTLDWMARWIKDPKSLSPTTRMPQFKITEDEAKSVAHYLASLGGSVPMTAEEKAVLGKGSPEEGKRLVKDLACIACHKIGEEGETFAPNLSHVGNKVRPEWIYRWLKNPREYLPHGKMPNMRLKDEEIAHLVSYLTTLKDETWGLDPSKEESVDATLAEKGKKLIGTLGCFGCHNIPGMENRPRVGAELTAFGAKDLSLLFFGYAHDVPHTLWDWTFNKVKNPQIYATERIEQKMPNFHLSDEEINSLVTLLTSFKGEEKEIPLQLKKNLSTKEEAIEKGRNLVRDLNCMGCHTIEGKGATIAPNLEGEGAKVQPEWLFSFLKSPISIRPWLTVRMPKFNLSDEDASSIVSYFSSLSDAKYPYEFDYFGEVQVPERERKAGEKLFEMFKCMSCHPVSMDPSTKGSQVVNLGPNLGLAKDRLRHEWIAQWILQPEVLQPGTKMPTNFPKMGDKRVSFVPNLLKTPQFKDTKQYFENLFGSELDAFLADPLWQTKSIRDYIVSMNSFSTSVTSSKTEVSSQSQTSPQVPAQTQVSVSQKAQAPTAPSTSENTSAKKPPSEDGF